MTKSARSLVRIACLAFVVCSVVLSLPYESAAVDLDTDSGKAIVKDGTVLVHLAPSARSKVVRSLNKGAEVIVGIEMKTSDGDWCGIADQGMSSISGYIPCDSIEQLKKVPVAWKSIGPKSEANQSRPTASRSVPTPRPYSDITVRLYMTTW